MSFNKTINPDFHGYTMVFVHYCDGSSMSSFREAPMNTNGQLVWYRGKANLAAVFEHLQVVHKLDAASEVILSGGSAGGLAVYYHIDWVAETVRSRSPTARVTGFPDAGYFADLQNTTGSFDYRSFFQTADNTAWNTTLSGGVNSACLRTTPTADSWQCLMAQYLTDHIVTPMFVLNAAFDVYQVQHILEVGCVPEPCSPTQITQIEEYRKQYINDSLKHLVGRANSIGHGAFISSCLLHEVNVDYCSGGNPHAYNCAGWTTLSVDKLTPQQAYSKWYKGIAPQNLTIDSTAVVENPTCPYHLRSQ